METIQVVIDAPLLKQADRTAKKLKVNRSELVRMALREQIRKQQIVEREERERQGYEKLPADTEELAAWETQASWPEE